MCNRQHDGYDSTNTSHFTTKIVFFWNHSSILHISGPRVMTLLKNLYYSRRLMYSICDNWYKARNQKLAEESHNENGHILFIFLQNFMTAGEYRTWVKGMGDRGASTHVSTVAHHMAINGSYHFVILGSVCK